MSEGILIWSVKETSMLKKFIKKLKKNHLQSWAIHCMKSADVERQQSTNALKNAAWYEDEALRTKLKILEL